MLSSTKLFLSIAVVSSVLNVGSISASTLDHLEAQKNKREIANESFIKSFPVTIHNHTDKKEKIGIRFHLICSKTKTTFMNIIDTLANGHEVKTNKSCGSKSVVVKIGDSGKIKSPSFSKLGSSSIKNYLLIVSLVKELADGSLTDLSMTQTLDGNYLYPYNEQSIDLTKRPENVEFSIYNSPEFKINSDAPRHYFGWTLVPENNPSSGFSSFNNILAGLYAEDVDLYDQTKKKAEKFNRTYLLVNGNPGVHVKATFLIRDIENNKVLSNNAVEYKDLALTIKQSVSKQ